MALDRDRFRRGASKREKPEQKKVILTPDNKIPSEILPVVEKKEEKPVAVNVADQPEKPADHILPIEPVTVEMEQASEAEITELVEKPADIKEKRPNRTRIKLLALVATQFALRPPKGKWIRLAGTGLVGLVLLFVVVELVVLATHKNPPPVKPKTVVQAKYVYKEVEAGNIEIPFNPAVPNDEPQLAKLAATNYSAIAKSYTFSDLYLGVPIQVSEQEMPKTFPTQAQTLAAVSKSLPADTSFSSDYGTVYLNNAATQAKQTLVFSRFGLLIFIQSNYDINNAGWNSYIDNLEQAD